MSVILILILASLLIAVTFLLGFIWAVRSGQYEDTCTPGMRVLAEEEAARREGERPREPHLLKPRNSPNTRNTPN